MRDLRLRLLTLLPGHVECLSYAMPGFREPGHREDGGRLCRLRAPSGLLPAFGQCHRQIDCRPFRTSRSGVLFTPERPLPALLRAIVDPGRPNAAGRDPKAALLRRLILGDSRSRRTARMAASSPRFCFRRRCRPGARRRGGGPSPPAPAAPRGRSPRLAHCARCALPAAAFLPLPVLGPQPTRRCSGWRMRSWPPAVPPSPPSRPQVALASFSSAAAMPRRASCGAILLGTACLLVRGLCFSPSEPPDRNRGPVPRDLGLRRGLPPAFPLAPLEAPLPLHLGADIPRGVRGVCPPRTRRKRPA